MVDADVTFDDSRSVALSREIVVASVDAELKTLAADDEVVDAAASIELRVEARLCFEVLRRSMLSGREGALSPGLSVLPGAGGDDEEGAVVAAACANEANFGVEGEAHRRPKKREAAVVTSNTRVTSVLLGLATELRLASLYPCSSAAIRSLVTTSERLTKSWTNSLAL